MCAIDSDRVITRIQERARPELDGGEEQEEPTTVNTRKECGLNDIYYCTGV